MSVLDVGAVGKPDRFRGGVGRRPGTPVP